MGRSGKPDIAYRLADQVRYVEAFVDALGLTEITFVAHDWGVAISLDYLRRHPDQVRALAFMEGHIRPVPGWAEFDPGGRAIFADRLTPGLGERMVLTENFFLDTLLPAAIGGTLTEQSGGSIARPTPTPRRAARFWPGPGRYRSPDALVRRTPTQSTHPVAARHTLSGGCEEQVNGVM